MTPSARVLIVEDHQLLAQSLGVVLEAEGMEVRLAPLAAEEVLAAARRLDPHVVLLDLDLGGGRARGEALLPDLLEVGARVVVVSGTSDAARLGTCLEMGAAAVMSKSRPFEDVLAAVRQAAAGTPAMSDGERQQVLADMRRLRRERATRSAPFERMTPREGEVLSLLMEGRSANAVARHFVVSEATVRSQIRGILTKLGVSSQLSAVAEAHRVGWEGPRHSQG